MEQIFWGELLKYLKSFSHFKIDFKFNINNNKIKKALKILKENKISDVDLFYI